MVLRRLRLRLHPTSGFRTLLGPPSRSLCSASAPPVAHEKPFWADAVGLAGFGLIGLQWLMSDMLTLRTVAIVVAAAVRFRRMATGGGSSWFGVVDGIGAAAGSTSNNTNSNNRDHRGRGRATDSDGRDGSRRGKIPTSLLRTSDLPNPDPVLPPLELLASGPEGELFEVLVEKLTGQRARWCGRAR